ncbi:drug resistance transporter, EmrB/QacA subfamily [Terrimicrobium sacchariphilum]|uniref:Drug resistance transporter, EmrB/QacA subfamily n=1 Tax=Terrimicrobium sacchariphilum TaxID=690879 RepID=A0A146G9W6_TERSA|nr:MFS transporter [Terrimicrobium sacchariphilum]GAT34445.1 drug resistance transporter, EmrB/QacA subfamily [Terrimicrobium sacchariphilum]
MNIPGRPILKAAHGPNRRWWVLGAVECGNFVVYMDAFIVTLALPAMAAQFGIGLHEVKWVMLSYMIALTASLLVAGRLGDRLGRKTVTILGMGALAAASLACLFAPTLAVLIACRAVQGIGGALVLANVMAEITAVFPKVERRRAMAINASVLAMGQVVGLLLGGALIGAFGWRSIFLVIALISSAGLLLDALILRNQSCSRAGRFDLAGAMLSIPLIGIPFLLVERLASRAAQGFPWELLGAGLGLLVIFLVVELRMASPLLDPRVFRLRAYVCGSFAAAAYFVAAASCYFLVPLYAQAVLGLTPFQAGLLMLPLSVALTTTSQIIGGLSKYISARVVASFGLLCTAGGVLALSFLGPTGGLLLVAGIVALIGAGGGLFHPPNNTSVLAAVPQSMLGSANGFFAMARNFGQALGVSLAAAILGATVAGTGAGKLLAGYHPEHAREAVFAIYTSGQSAAFHLAAMIGLVGAIVSAFRGPPIMAPPPEDLKTPASTAK